MDIQPKPFASATIVIVDDDAAVRAALGFALETEGYRVRAFRSARDAFTAEGLADAACLVIDQNLPDEQGIDFLARLRARGVKTPAVVITTNPARTLRAHARALDAPLVEKPLLDDQLFACIRALTA